MAYWSKSEEKKSKGDGVTEGDPWSCYCRNHHLERREVKIREEIEGFWWMDGWIKCQKPQRKKAKCLFVCNLIEGRQAGRQAGTSKSLLEIERDWLTASLAFTFNFSTQNCPFPFPFPRTPTYPTCPNTRYKIHYFEIQNPVVSVS